MKIAYSFFGILLIIVGIRGASYFYTHVNHGADAVDTVTIILFTAIVPVLFGLMFLTTPKDKINKTTNLSLWLLCLTIVLTMLYFFAGYMAPEAGLLIVPIFALLIGIPFVLSFGLLFVGRFKSSQTLNK